VEVYRQLNVRFIRSSSLLYCVVNRLEDTNPRSTHFKSCVSAPKTSLIVIQLLHLLNTFDAN